MSVLWISISNGILRNFRLLNRPCAPTIAWARSEVKSKVFHQSISNENFCIHKTKSISLQQVSLILHGSALAKDERRRRKKNETKIITRARARITTRTGEIPLLIPNLSGCCCAVAISLLFSRGICVAYTWLFTHIFQSKREQRNVYSGKK